MATVDQGYNFEIVAKTIHIYPNPKTLSCPNIRTTIGGAVHENSTNLPATTSTCQARTRKRAVSVPNLEEANPLHDHQQRKSPPAICLPCTSGRARFQQCNLREERSGHEVRHERQCAKTPQQQSSTTDNNDLTCSAKQVPVGSAAMREKPTLPENFMQLAPRAKLKTIKQFLDGFDYKQTPGTHFNTHKLRPLARIMDIARMIIYSPQPIKCIEAVFVALSLTAGIADCDRIPLSFKSSHCGQVYQHIVLLIRYGNKFGAFGISRNPDLMTKDIKYSSICHVVENYKKSYEEAEHLVLKIRVGLQVEHKVDSPNHVCWRHLCLNPPTQPWEKCCEALEIHLLKQKKLWSKWILAGKGVDPKRESLARKAALDNKLLRNGLEIKQKKKLEREDPAALEIPKLAKTETIEERMPYNKTTEPLPQDMIEVSKAKKENTEECQHVQSKAKPLIKVLVLKTQASKYIRRAQFANPKLVSSKNFAKAVAHSYQCGRMAKLSLNLVPAKQTKPLRRSKGH